MSGRWTPSRVVLAALVSGTLLALVAVSAAPRELGDVRWGRELGAALESSRASGKPVFALFQEVPGCQTCVSFGDEVLSHPLLVEAIEDAFVPLAIYNNRPGADRAALERFGEPAWNNPVVRFLDADGRDLVPRRDGVWSPFLVARRMIETLERAERPVPSYLRAAERELTPRHTEHATLSMYCYWSGEAGVGAIDGVTSTRTGAVGGREVVAIEFDPAVVSYEALLRTAKRRGCADRVFAHSSAQERTARDIFGAVERSSRESFRDARAKDQRYYLRRSRFAKLELTDAQSMRVNAALGAESSPLPWLSPRQRAELDTR